MDKDKAFILEYLKDHQDIRYLDIINNQYFENNPILAKTLINELASANLLQPIAPGPFNPKDNPYLKITRLGRDSLSSYTDYQHRKRHEWINTCIAGIALLLSLISLFLINRSCG